MLEFRYRVRGTGRDALFRVSQRAVKIKKSMHMGEACGLALFLQYTCFAPLKAFIMIVNQQPLQR